MKILLVEDEVHKRDELKDCVQEALGEFPKVIDCVSNAVLDVMENNYDLIILDMALSTFGDGAEDKIKGHDQAQGGIEVLRALKQSKKLTKIIIVTQYPDFYIGGKKVKLKDSANIILEKYNQTVLGTILYHYKSNTTQQKIISILRSCK
ncbi:hypothetical protein ACIKP9_02630 [Methylobacillus methanolivorans]|uniref:Response regulatory domain-containing protein n=1 Tax=Methylobacillus methanolivorans TaxID=1848927 RepID=A0ABW8GIA4_9PROT